jgi:hypothetical protein
VYACLSLAIGELEHAQSSPSWTSLPKRVGRSVGQGRAVRPCRRQPRRGDLDGRDADATIMASPGGTSAEHMLGHSSGWWAPPTWPGLLLPGTSTVPGCVQSAESATMRQSRPTVLAVRLKWMRGSALASRLWPPNACGPPPAPQMEQSCEGRPTERILEAPRFSASARGGPSIRSSWRSSSESQA